MSHAPRTVQNLLELSRRGYYDMPGQLHSGASISGSCPATRSCRTTGNCCGSCSSGSGSSLQCMAYTFGDTCSNTPISCPTLFDPLPSDETGSRPSGSCPASRPYQTDKGCCGACRTDQGTVMAFDCGTTCSSSPRPGRFVHSRHLPPQHSSGCLLCSFRWLESQLRWHLCTCHTTGWPLSTGLKLECLAQMAATGLDVGLRKDMQVCQDPMSFTPSVMIPLAGWQNGEHRPHPNRGERPRCWWSGLRDDHDGKG